MVPSDIWLDSSWLENHKDETASQTDADTQINETEPAQQNNYDTDNVAGYILPNSSSEYAGRI